MRPMKKILWAVALALPFLVLNAAPVLGSDDYTPEVTARVARISFLYGNVQIKRSDADDWERATNNLPIVEGDELATETGARVEIQFNSETYVRLSENAYLKITTLRDEGIAVSLPNGSLSARVLNFNKDRQYFEIDAPQTTVSIERTGMYRVDAGNKDDREIRIAVTDSGQAKVYSANSGFTLKNGRSATIQIEGDLAGEWQTSDAARYADEFDRWALERDAVIAKRLEDAYYDKYYDRDIYGAEDLSEYGDWIFTKKYGYVWRPYRSATSAYSNWSPYRYGQWRWVPAYGWTWVNDEPWGWATYHHGRWVYDAGGWYWSPYPQTRWRRSWWRPALVVISYIGSNICWYPLPYHYGYYNYNSYYYDRRRYNNTTIINNTTTVIVNPTPTPGTTPIPTGTKTVNSEREVNASQLPPSAVIPPSGVVSVEVSSFGTGKGKFRTAPTDLATEVLAQAPRTETIRVLPTRKDLGNNLSPEITVANPRTDLVRNAAQIKTGAVERDDAAPTGETLRKERILGNRPLLENPAPATNSNGLENAPPRVRNTGAIPRQPRTETLTESNPVLSPSDGGVRPPRGVRNTGSETVNQPPRRPRVRDDQEVAPPVYNPPPPRRPREENVELPRPPRQQPSPRQEPPREQPRLEPTEPREKPRREQPPPQQPTSPPADSPAPNVVEPSTRRRRDG